MSDHTFGDRVTVTAVVGKLRRDMHARVKVDWKGEPFHEDSERDETRVITQESARLTLGHGRRSHATSYFDREDPFAELDVLDAPDPDFRLPWQGFVTHVQLVRVPVQRVRDWNWDSSWAKGVLPPPSDDPIPGIVIGHTHRQCGTIRNYGEGNTWTNHGAVSVVIVAVESDHSAEIYDVHPDDVRGDA